MRAKKGANPKKANSLLLLWRPQGDSNPCRRRERPVSWAGLDDGDAGKRNTNYLFQINQDQFCAIDPIFIF
jgi:hypothetical protein